MKRLSIIILLALPAIVFAQDNTKYDYVIISQEGEYILVTEGTEKYDFLRVKEEIEKGALLDNRPLLKRVMEYEDEEWETMSYSSFYSSSAASPISQFVLRRKRK